MQYGTTSPARINTQPRTPVTRQRKEKSCFLLQLDGSDLKPGLTGDCPARNQGTYDITNLL